MAVLNPKPFTEAAKMFKRIFKGKPNIFADVDINQLNDADFNGFKRMSETVGAFAIGYTGNPPSIVYDGGLETTYTYAGGGKLFANKVMFDIPAFNFSNEVAPNNLPSNIDGGSNIDNAIVNFWFVAEVNNIDFTADQTIGGVNGVGLVSPLPSSDSVVYENEKIVFTVGKDVQPSLASNEELICLFSQIAFHHTPDNGQDGNGYTAYFEQCCPNIQDIYNNTEISGADFRVYSHTNSLYANFQRFVVAIKDRVENVYDYLENYINDVEQDLNGFISTFPTNVLNYIRNYAHTYTKTQTWSFGTATYDQVTRKITISDTGNHFNIVVPTDSSLEDIVYSTGTVPTGTLITIRFKHSSPIPNPLPVAPFLIDLSATSNISSHEGNNNTDNLSILHQVHGNFLEGDLITFRKTSAKWEIVSLNRFGWSEVSKANKIQSNWELPTFNAGWQTDPLGTEPVKYFKDSIGNVHIRGIAKRFNSAGNPTIFTLLEGYRPTTQLSFPTLHYNTVGVSTHEPKVVFVNTDGTVTCSLNSDQAVLLNEIIFATH